MAVPWRRVAIFSTAHSVTDIVTDDGRRRLDYALGRGKRPRTLHCRWCKTKIEIKSRGRVAEFCSQTCRQPGYEQRKWARPAAIEVVAQHLAAAKVREAIRAEVWSLLREIGLVAAAEPPPMPKKPGKPTLRLVKPEPPADI